MSRKKILKFEELEDFVPQTIGDRVNYVIAANRLNGAQFAKMIGISGGNLSSIINDDVNPSAHPLIQIFVRFGVDINWLLTGQGTMLVDKTGKNGCFSGKNEVEPEFKIADALAMTASVLESGTSYATALYLNIQHFDRAVKAEARLATLEADMHTLTDKMARMERQIAELMHVNEAREAERGEKNVKNHTAA